MSIVKLKNKKTGIVYVYESESYWDKEKQQPRNKRKLIGKLDEAGNIVPTGKSGRKKKETENLDENMAENELNRLKADLEDALSKIKEKEIRIAFLEKQREETEKTLRRLLERLS